MPQGGTVSWSELGQDAPTEVSWGRLELPPPSFAAGTPPLEGGILAGTAPTKTVPLGAETTGEGVSNAASPGDVLEGGAKALGRGFADMGASAVETIGMAARGQGQREGWHENAEMIRDYWNKALESPAKTKGSMLETTLEGVGNAIGGLPLSLAGPLAVGIGYGAQGFSQNYYEAKGAGADDEHAMYSGLVGMAGGATEVLDPTHATLRLVAKPLVKLNKATNGGVVKLMLRPLIDAGGNFLQEGMQSLISDAGTEAFTDKDVDMLSNALKGGKAGFGASLILSALFGIAANGQRSRAAGGQHANVAPPVGSVEQANVQSQSLSGKPMDVVGSESVGAPTALQSAPNALQSAPAAVPPDVQADRDHLIAQASRILPPEHVEALKAEFAKLDSMTPKEIQAKGEEAMRPVEPVQGERPKEPEAAQPSEPVATQAPLAAGEAQLPAPPPETGREIPPVATSVPATMPTEEGLFGAQEKPASTVVKGVTPKTTQGMLIEGTKELPGQTSLLDATETAKHTAAKKKLSLKQRVASIKSGAREGSTGSLEDFVRAHGGLNLGQLPGEMKALRENTGKAKFGLGPLVRVKGGSSIESMREDALNAGFFTEQEFNSMSESDFIEAIVEGRLHPAEDERRTLKAQEADLAAQHQRVVDELGEEGAREFYAEQRRNEPDPWSSQAGMALNPFSPRRKALIDEDAGFSEPEHTRTRQFVEYVFNDMDRLVQMERAAPVGLKGDTLAETTQLYPGRKFGESEKFDRRVVQPTKDVLKKWKIDPIDDNATGPSWSNYLYALHAPRANEVGMKRHPRKFDLEENPASGMGNAESAEILARAKASPSAAGYERLKNLNRLTNRIRLGARESGGLYVPETFTKDGERVKSQRESLIEEFGEDYVPLMTEYDPDTEHLRAAGFSIRGKESKRREGRKSKASPVGIFALSTAHEALQRKERNRVGNAIAELSTRNPELPWRVVESLSKVKESETALPYKDAGVQKWIVTSDKGTIAAFKRLTIEPGVIEYLDPALNYLHQVIISKNPFFPPVNFFKDVLTAAHKLAITDGPAFAADVVAHAPAAARGAWRAIRNEGAEGKWEDAYRDMRDGGGLIGWAHQFDFQERVTDFKRALAAGDAMSQARAFGKLIEDMGRAAELGPRLATYVAAKNRGKTNSQANVMGRSVTADFAQRGSLIPAARRFYMFIGANLQGGGEFIKAVKERPGRAAVVAGADAVFFGFLTALFSRMFGGEEEETGRQNWDLLSTYEKSKRIGVMVDGNHVGLPAPYLFNFFPFLGTAAEELAFGDKPFGKVATDVMNVLLDAVIPMQGADALQTGTPTLAKPALEIATNTDFTGRSIMPAENVFDANPEPDSERYWPDVNPVAKDFAQGINRLTGGDAVEEGGVSFSPETVEHMGKFLTGGLGSNLGRLLDVAQKKIEGVEPVRATDFPIVRAFVGQVSPHIVDSVYSEERARVDLQKKRMKAGLSFDRRAFRAAAGLAEAERGIKELKEALPGAKTEAQRRKIEKRIHDIKVSFIRHADRVGATK